MMTLAYFLAALGLAIILYGVYRLVSREETTHSAGPTTPPDSGPDVPRQRPEALVEDLDIPTRAKNALLDQNIKVVAELENLDGELSEIPGIGESYAEDIEEALREE